MEEGFALQNDYDLTQGAICRCHNGSAQVIEFQALQVDGVLSVGASELENFDGLVESYRGYIFRYVQSLLRNQDIAESVTQDCFMRAYSSRAQFRGECSVRTWLTAIARNLIRDQTRTKRFQFWKTVSDTAVQLGEIHDRVAARQLSPESSVLVREQVVLVWDAVSELSATQRQIFLMRYKRDMQLSEIAQEMNMSLSAVKTGLNRGLRSVRLNLTTPNDRRAHR